MKNIIKLFGLIALAAIIIFSFPVCGGDDGNSNNSSNNNNNNSGNNGNNNNNGNGSGNIAVTFKSMTANGSATQTTTQLTLTFDKEITGLSASDITLTGVSNVSKGTLSNSGAVYTLPISGFTAGGTLSAAVSKSGYTITGSPKTAAIFYNGTTPNPPPAVPLHSKWPFYVGAAVPAKAFSPGSGQYSLLGHFNVLVAEDEMKPESIMPSQWQNWQSSPASMLLNLTVGQKLIN